jgi:hypothetical protein
MAMADNDSRPTTLAVLIDGDNVSPAMADWLFTNVEMLGKPIVRRVYGDNLDKWRLATRKYVLEQRSVVPNVGRKNAADFMMVIEAMDLLHEGQVGGFCIVSSDSDFTALATRLTRAGRQVYGFGNKGTPEPLRRAMSWFKEIDSGEVAAKSVPSKQPAKASPSKKTSPAKKTSPPKKAPASTGASVARQPAPAVVDEAAIIAAIEATKADSEGYVAVSNLGKVLRASGIIIKHLGAKLEKFRSIERSGSGNTLRVRVKAKSPRPVTR